VPLLLGSYAPDMMSKWFVYGIHIGGWDLKASDPVQFHRGWPGVGFTHSLLYGVVIAFLFWRVPGSKTWAVSFLIGQWAHAITDTGDTVGTMLFFPWTVHIHFGAWAYAGQTGRVTDAAAYFSGPGAVWDLVWIVYGIFCWRVLTRSYFEQHVFTADVFWSRANRMVPVAALLILYRAAFFYGTSRWIAWSLWAHVVHDYPYDISWGRPPLGASRALAEPDLASTPGDRRDHRHGVGGRLHVPARVRQEGLGGDSIEDLILRRLGLGVPHAPRRISRRNAASARPWALVPRWCRGLLLGRHDLAWPLGCSSWYRARDRGGVRLRGRRRCGREASAVALRDCDRFSLVPGRDSDRLVRLPLAPAAPSPCCRQLQHLAGDLRLGWGREAPPPAPQHGLQRALLQRLQRPAGPARLGGADTAPRRQRPGDLRGLERPEAGARRQGGAGRLLRRRER
jgi:hypothetical protein